jgi:hypothetical protein
VSIHLLNQYGVEVDTGHWQGVPTEGKPDLVTKELMNLTFEVPMPLSADELIGSFDGLTQLIPNLPWAENHFQERVSRVPSNPGEEYKNWPWWRGQGVEAMTHEGVDEGEGLHMKPIFTHTYQERFWPKQAGNWKYIKRDEQGRGTHGIRYPYGDLDDVVNLLRREPFTRQATLPIFFPEDTGAVHGGRIPCTLHYHFLRRGDHLNLWYAIRSCDAVRHFHDDLYLAVRLCQWVLRELTERSVYHADDGTSGYDDDWYMVEPGMLHFTAYSFHVHKGDIHLL